jgi:signal peptidase II
VNGDRAAKLKLLGSVIGGVVVVDVITKLVIQATFSLHAQVDVVGDFFRLTYIQNPGAAFGIYLGRFSRGIFLALSLAALAVLGWMYWFTPVRERARLVAIALIAGGALGNLVDRLRTEHGVIDFIDIGLGSLRWPVFNVADMAVTTGAVVLALSLWREERRGRKPG